MLRKRSLAESLYRFPAEHLFPVTASPCQSNSLGKDHRGRALELLANYRALAQNRSVEGSGKFQTIEFELRGLIPHIDSERRENLVEVVVLT